MNADEDYEQEDDDYFDHSVKRNSQNNDGTWLETVQEAFIGLGAAFDFSGTQAIANLSR